MFYNEARTAMHFKAYRVPVRCWRCWKRYEFFAPYEFVDVLLYNCERCHEIRATEAYGSGHGLAREKFLDLKYPTLRGWGRKEELDDFLRLFENQWTEPCSCGGRFRLRAPIRCPHCRAPECRLLRGRAEIVESPPLSVLQFTIPPEYANAQARPPWQPKAKVKL